MRVSKPTFLILPLAVYSVLACACLFGTTWRDCEHPYVILADPVQYSELERLAEEITSPTPFIAEVGKSLGGDVYIDYVIGKSPGGKTLSPSELKARYYETGEEDFVARQWVGSETLGVSWTESFSRGLRQMSEAVDIASQLGKPITRVEGYVSEGLEKLVQSGNFSKERFSRSWNAVRQEKHPTEKWEVSLEVREGRTYLVRQKIQD